MATVVNTGMIGPVDKHLVGRADDNAPLNVFDVTPSDTVNLVQDIRALYVGVSGNVVVTTPKGNDITYTALAAGVWHPIAARRIKATSTTATSIKGGY